MALKLNVMGVNVWKTLKIGAVIKYGDIRVINGRLIQLPSSEVGKRISVSDGHIIRRVKKPGPKYRTGEPTKRLTLRIPESLLSRFPEDVPVGTWASDEIIKILKKR